MTRRRERTQEHEHRQQSDHQQWAGIQQIQRNRERAELRFEIGQQQNRRQEHQLEVAEASGETGNCIAEFERNMQRMGLSGDDASSGISQTSLQASERQQLNTTASMNPVQHLNYCASMLPDKTVQIKLGVYKH